MSGAAPRIPAPDTVIVLHSRGPLLAKRIGLTGITDYDDARTFDIYPVTVANVDDIGRLLSA